MKIFVKKYYFLKKIQAKLNTWILIRIPNTDPDPESVAQRIRILSGA
jgi:hypothetical protein